MKIVITGGGSGGHFYPAMAVAKSLRDVAKKNKITSLSLYYMADTPYSEKILYDQEIKYIEVPTGKMRLYFSVQNFFDVIKTFFAVIVALRKLFSVYPDIVFSKGGYPSVPVTIAARILGIPVFLHDSDAAPGRANKMASKWAKRIAISFKEAAEFFPKEKTAFVGHVIRDEMQNPVTEGAYEYLKLNPALPIIVILGGSQGAEKINDIILNTLPELIEKYQIIHQTGSKNFKETVSVTNAVLDGNPNMENYRPFPYLNTLAMRMLGGVSDIVMTRAGASSLGEIAYWNTPAIIIPITNSNGDHQRKNAYAYARTGGAVVIEEKNLQKNILLSEIKRIMDSEEIRNEMVSSVKDFQFPNAADKIAEEIMFIAKQHER